ncbi:hypothetical protein [Chlamydiifrater phoenicopteri]|uniref:hypothetical protein n=1 Tax=Chlamydiifrater phoenicopteri TaxID=2681469 RepID=UPI001BD08D71|nr:hypothetical protein [Chlamydiifrater phoenicopteri]
MISTQCPVEFLSLFRTQEGVQKSLDEKIEIATRMKSLFAKAVQGLGAALLVSLVLVGLSTIASISTGLNVALLVIASALLIGFVASSAGHSLISKKQKSFLEEKKLEVEEEAKLALERAVEKASKLKLEEPSGDEREVEKEEHSVRTSESPEESVAEEELQEGAFTTSESGGEEEVSEVKVAEANETSEARDSTGGDEVDGIKARSASQLEEEVQVNETEGGEELEAVSTKKEPVLGEKNLIEALQEAVESMKNLAVLFKEMLAGGISESPVPLLTSSLEVEEETLGGGEEEKKVADVDGQSGAEPGKEEAETSGATS